MKYLLDTNTCIYLIKEKTTVCTQRIQSMRINEIGISTITFAELEYGVSKSSLPEKNKLALLKFVAPLEILSFTARAAQTYGQIRAYLEKSGQIIGSLDLVIGSHAKSENLILVTNNVSEFSRIADLNIENWV